MVKKCLFYAILIVYENTHEIYKHCLQVDLDGWGVAKRYQVHLWHKTGKNLTDTDRFENIHLIQACIYHDYYKILIMAIHHNLPLFYNVMIFKDVW